MPKLGCRCGFVHNLSPIPDDGWQVIRDKDMEAYIQHYRAFEDGFRAPEGSSEREAAEVGLDETIRMRTSLYECPLCGRILWNKNKTDDEDNFEAYIPENLSEEALAAYRENVSNHKDEIIENLWARLQAEEQERRRLRALLTALQQKPAPLQQKSAPKGFWSRWLGGAIEGIEPVDSVSQYLILTTLQEKQIHAPVAYLQPKERRTKSSLGFDTAVVQIATKDLLDADTYSAIYTSPAQVVAGTYDIQGSVPSGAAWLYTGTFTCARKDETLGEE